MGWSGDINELLHVLRTLGADQDEQGKFIVSGGICLFMGIGPDCVVDDEAKYMKGGEWYSMAAALGATSYGLKVTVIS